MRGAERSKRPLTREEVLKAIQEKRAKFMVCGGTHRQAARVALKVEMKDRLSVVRPPTIVYWGENYVVTFVVKSACICGNLTRIDNVPKQDLLQRSSLGSPGFTTMTRGMRWASHSPTSYGASTSRMRPSRSPSLSGQPPLRGRTMRTRAHRGSPAQL